MTVQMKKGTQIVVPAYRNVVFIEANYMHGDANGYTKETVFYRDDQTDDINFDLEGLAFLKTIMNGTYAITNEHAALATRQFFEANAFFNIDEDQVENFIEQFVIQDDHDDSYEYAATLVAIHVFAHDGQGERFVMDVNVNGKPIND